MYVYGFLKMYRWMKNAYTDKYNYHTCTIDIQLKRIRESWLNEGISLNWQQRYIYRVNQK